MSTFALETLPEHRKNAFLQGARGLFALFVFVYHVHHSGLSTFPILQSGIPKFLLDTLEHGVELFFGISGTVIVGSIYRQGSVASFVLSRLKRLLPVLWVSNLFVLAVASTFHLPLPSTANISASFFLPPPFLNVALVNPISWTLSFELCFYVFCVIWWRFQSNNRVLSILVLTASVWLFVYPRTTMMLVGVLVATRRFDSPWVKMASRVSIAWLLMYLIGLRAIVEWFGHGSVDAANPLLIAPPLIPLFELALWLVTGIGGVALVGILAGHGVLGRFLGSPAMVWLGTISFSFYMWHIPVMAGIKRVMVAAGLGDSVFSQLGFLVLSLPVALAVAVVSFRILEVQAAALAAPFLGKHLGIANRSASRPATAGQDTCAAESRATGR